MYEKPTVKRFGTFRELTQLGCGSDGDTGAFGFIPPAIGGTIGQCFDGGGS